jgi:hypothetical protein
MLRDWSAKNVCQKARGLGRLDEASSLGTGQGLRHLDWEDIRDKKLVLLLAKAKPK